MRKWMVAQLGTVFLLSEEEDPSWIVELCEQSDYALACALIVTGAV